MYILGDSHSIPINVGTEIYAKEGRFYDRNEVLASFDPWLEPIITEVSGRVEFVDIELNKSLREEMDHLTGNLKRVIVEYKTEKLQPRVDIYPSAGEPTTYLLPKGAHIMVTEGETVKGGTILAKIPREVEKTKDITGGLPRVAELFEARSPKNAATLAELDGTVTIGDTSKNKRKIIITGEDGVQKEYSIPASKFLRVQDGDWISKGEKIVTADRPRILRRGRAIANSSLRSEVYRLRRAISDRAYPVCSQMLRECVSKPQRTMFVVEQSLLNSTLSMASGS